MVCRILKKVIRDVSLNTTQLGRIITVYRRSPRRRNPIAGGHSRKKRKEGYKWGLKKNATVLSKQQRGVAGKINVCLSRLPGRLPGSCGDGYNNNTVHFITSNNKVRKSSGKESVSVVQRSSLKGREWGILCRMTRSSFIVHYSTNTERSSPAKGRVHNVPPDDTLTVLADDF